MEREAMRPGEPGYELLVLIALLSAQPMIHVGNLDLERASRSVGQKQPQHPDRIPATGDRGQDVFARHNHSVALQGLLKGLLDSGIARGGSGLSKHEDP